MTAVTAADQEDLVETNTAVVEDVETAPAVAVEEELLVEDVSIDGMCGVY